MTAGVPFIFIMAGADVGFTQYVPPDSVAVIVTNITKK